MESTKLQLPYGYTKGLPEDVRVAWGARLIWPDDLLPDRQGCAGGTPGDEERTKLLVWLGDGAGDKARAECRRLEKEHEWWAGSGLEQVLYEDEHGKIIGNPQRSYGYVYIAAWLFEHQGD